MSNAHLFQEPNEMASTTKRERAGQRKEVPAPEPALDQFVMRTLEQLELPCRYSVVYELTRIECLLNRPAYEDEFVAEPLAWPWSISA